MATFALRAGYELLVDSARVEAACPAHDHGVRPAEIRFGNIRKRRRWQICALPGLESGIFVKQAPHLGKNAVGIEEVLL